MTEYFSSLNSQANVELKNNTCLQVIFTNPVTDFKMYEVVLRVFKKGETEKYAVK